MKRYDPESEINTLDERYLLLARDPGMTGQDMEYYFEHTQETTKAWSVVLMKESLESKHPVGVGH